MKKTTILSLVAIMAIGVFVIFSASEGLDAAGKNGITCTTIQSGNLVDSKGNTIVTVYDQWGYNYQAHMFNGYYDNYTRPDSPVMTGDHLMMKWNDAWLANEDCDDNSLLDRHYGFDSYIGSGAWLTNHMSGTYMMDETECNWDYFVKIVAAPADAVKDGAVWYTADSEEIGPVIWGDFAIIQEVENDACAGREGISYLSPVGPGLGKF